MEAHTHHFSSRLAQNQTVEMSSDYSGLFVGINHTAIAIEVMKSDGQIVDVIGELVQLQLFHNHENDAGEAQYFLSQFQFGFVRKREDSIG
jgi:hypothetical protein